ncbi:hypothetical protein BB561_004511 [Smittium simulii]|uniref:Uncharacterized protein n=1 Tax=Smittium simulii TaxID=133385 RepID=A0A2T9YFY0_9FUNG|nr:hypothetical protein BB561_004511 [Smittium simulii]
MSSKEGKIIINGIPVGRDVFLSTNSDIPGPGQYDIISPTPISANKFSHIYEHFKDSSPAPDKLKRSSSFKRRPLYTADAQNEKAAINRQSVSVFTSKDLNSIPTLSRSDSLNSSRSRSRMSSNVPLFPNKTFSKANNIDKNQAKFIEQLEASNTSLKLQLRKISILSRTLLNSSLNNKQPKASNNPDLNTIKKLFQLTNNTSSELLNNTKSRPVSISNVDDLVDSNVQLSALFSDIDAPLLENSPKEASYPIQNEQIPLDHSNTNSFEIQTPTCKKQYQDSNLSSSGSIKSSSTIKVDTSVQTMPLCSNNLTEAFKQFSINEKADAHSQTFNSSGTDENLSDLYTENSKLKIDLSLLEQSLNEIQATLEKISSEKIFLEEKNLSLDLDLVNFKKESRNNVDQLKAQSEKISRLEALAEQQKLESAEATKLWKDSKIVVSDHIKKVVELSSIADMSRNKIESIQAENSKLTNQNTLLADKLENQNSKFTDLNKSLNQKLTENENLFKQIETLKAYQLNNSISTQNIKELEKRIQHTDELLVEATNQNKSLNSNIQQVQNELDTVNDIIKSKNTELDSHKDKYLQMEKTFIILQEENSKNVKLLEAQTDYRAKFEALENNNNELIQSNSDLKKKIHEKTIELGNILTRKKREQIDLKSSIAKLSNELKEEKDKNSEIYILKDQNNEYSESNQRFKSELEAASAEIFNLKLKNNEFKDKLETFQQMNFEDNIKKLNNNIQTLQEDLDLGKAEQNNLIEQLNSTLKTNNDYENQIKQLYSSNAELKANQTTIELDHKVALSKNSEDNKSFTKEIDDFKGQITNLTGSLDMYKSKLKSLESELSENASDFELRKSMYKNNMDTLTVELKRLENDVESTKNQLKSSHDDKIALQTNINAIENDYNNLKKSLDENKEQLSISNQKISDLQKQLELKDQTTFELNNKLEKTLKKWSDAEQRAENSEEAVRLINDRFVLAMDELSKAEIQLSKSKNNN